MVIYYIVKPVGDICISYTLLFVYRIYCFMVILLPMVYPRFGSIIEQSPIAVPFSVRNALSLIIDRFV